MQPGLHCMRTKNHRWCRQTAEVPLDWTNAGAWATSSVTSRWRTITRKAEAPLDWTEAGAWTVSSVTRRWRAITRTGGWRSQVTMKLGPEQKERTERRKKRWRKGRRREQLTLCYYENFLGFCHQECRLYRCRYISTGYYLLPHKRWNERNINFNLNQIVVN